MQKKTDSTSKFDKIMRRTNFTFEGFSHNLEFFLHLRQGRIGVAYYTPKGGIKFAGWKMLTMSAWQTELKHVGSTESISHNNTCSSA